MGQLSVYHPIWAWSQEPFPISRPKAC